MPLAVREASFGKSTSGDYAMNTRFSVILVSLIGLQAPLTARSAPPPATEAPAGFDTPTLVQNPGSKSSSNGIAEPSGDTFVLDQQVYETLHDVNSGLGPGRHVPRRDRGFRLMICGIFSAFRES
jgi:hypothetical protein